MALKNGSTHYKNKKMSLINKWGIFILCSIAVAILFVCSWFIVKFQAEFPLLFKIIWFAIVIAVLISWLMIPFNGLKITSNGTVVFVADLRIKRVSLNELVSLNITFLKWQKNKYSVCLELTYKNGKYFKKDYSQQFKNLQRKKLLMSMYTISGERVAEIEQNLKDTPHCNISYALAE